MSDIDLDAIEAAAIRLRDARNSATMLVAREELFSVFRLEDLIKIIAAVRSERARADALQRHYDEAGPEHNLLALLDNYQDQILRLTHDRCEACDSAGADVARAESELGELRGDGCAYAQGAYGRQGCGKCIECERMSSAVSMHLLRRIVTYAQEDRARTPGVTRLARALDEARDMLNGGVANAVEKWKTTIRDREREALEAAAEADEWKARALAAESSLESESRALDDFARELSELLGTEYKRPSVSMAELRRALPELQRRASPRPRECPHCHGADGRHKFSCRTGREQIQQWKDANGYDDLLAAYSATIDERNALREHLLCVVKYAIEDRATTRGVTRLARELDRILKAFPEMDPYAKQEPKTDRYLPWQHAGGPNECAHGYAEGIPCPPCNAEKGGTPNG